MKWFARGGMGSKSESQGSEMGDLGGREALLDGEPKRSASPRELGVNGESDGATSGWREARRAQRQVTRFCLGGDCTVQTHGRPCSVKNWERVRGSKVWTEKGSHIVWAKEV